MAKCPRNKLVSGIYKHSRVSGLATLSSGQRGHNVRFQVGQVAVPPDGVQYLRSSEAASFRCGILLPIFHGNLVLSTEFDVSARNGRSTPPGTSAGPRRILRPSPSTSGSLGSSRSRWSWGGSRASPRSGRRRRMPPCWRTARPPAPSRRRGS